MKRFFSIIIAAAATGLSALPPSGLPEEYIGMKAYGKLDPARQGRAMVLNFVQLWINYQGGIDFQLRSEGVLLRPESEDVLYSAVALPRLRYVPGSRPELEKIVASLTLNLTTEQDKALAIMRFCRDLYLRKPYPVKWETYVFGGTEEELIAKGEILCEALARLQVALCEIAGIRGRIVMHVIGGHVTTELHVDGHWGYVDPRMGVYFLNADGKLASLRELCADPGLPDRQSEAVKHDVVGYETWANRRTRSAVYFSPAEVNLFEYYSLNDAARYDYHQVPRSAADAAGLREINREYSKIITEISEQAR